MDLGARASPPAPGRPTTGAGGDARAPRVDGEIE
jgi:hypothetical protein